MAHTGKTAADESPFPRVHGKHAQQRTRLSFPTSDTSIRMLVSFGMYHPRKPDIDLCGF